MGLFETSSSHLDKTHETSELTQNTNLLISNMAVLEFSKIEATKPNGQRMVLNTCVKLI